MQEPLKKELEIEENVLKRAAMIFRAVNHPLRMNMIHLIHEAGSIIVTDIYKKLAVEQSVASQHLAILRRAGFLLTERRGKYIYYSVNYIRLEEVQRVAGKIVGNGLTVVG